MQAVVGDAMPALIAGSILLMVGVVFRGLGKIHSLMYREVAEFGDHNGSTKSILRAILETQVQVEHNQKEMLQTQKDTLAVVRSHDQILHDMHHDAEASQ